MAVSDQYSAVTRARGMKKKKNLYAPMVQEQAAQGLGTQAVIARKQQEQTEAAQQFQQDQFSFQQEQAAQADEQWQAEQAMQQRQFDAQMDFQREQQSIADQAQQQQMILGGISTAANLFDAFGGMDWLSSFWS